MNGVILAAGRGSRLGQLTESVPKCLTPLRGKPLLEWQLRAMRGAGLSEIGIVRGYRPETLTRFDLRNFENPRWAETNTVASLCCAEAWLAAGTCIISYSDIVYPAATVRVVMDAPGDIVIPYNTEWLDVWQTRFPDPLSDAETFRRDERDRLIEIGGKPRTLSEIEGQYMGLLKFSPAGWGRIRDWLSRQPADRRDRLDMTSLLNGLLADGTEVRTVPVKGQWYEVDSESDLRNFSRLKGTSWLGA